METKIINLFAGPGAGKSTIASGLMYELKKQHISADNPYEFPKNLAWDENMGAIKDQFYITANQHRNIVRSYGKVDFVVCDSPILFALVYKEKYKKKVILYHLYTAKNLMLLFLIYLTDMII